MQKTSELFVDTRMLRYLLSSISTFSHFSALTLIYQHEPSQEQMKTIYLFVLSARPMLGWPTQPLHNAVYPFYRPKSNNSESQCDLPIYRHDTELRLNGKRWSASGANAYWLGLDENINPSSGQPFYSPTNASYPTFHRITEIMRTVQAMGGSVIRIQTLGVSVGNPLSVMTSLVVYNEEALATIALFQTRKYGMRILSPLTDNSVCGHRNI